MARVRERVHIIGCDLQARHVRPLIPAALQIYLAIIASAGRAATSPVCSEANEAHRSAVDTALGIKEQSARQSIIGGSALLAFARRLFLYDANSLGAHHVTDCRCTFFASLGTSRRCLNYAQTEQSERICADFFSVHHIFHILNIQNKPSNISYNLFELTIIWSMRGSNKKRVELSPIFMRTLIINLFPL